MKKEFLSTINDKKYNKRNRKRKIKRKNMLVNFIYSCYLHILLNLKWLINQTIRGALSDASDAENTSGDQTDNDLEQPEPKPAATKPHTEEPPKPSTPSKKPEPTAAAPSIPTTKPPKEPATVPASATTQQQQDDLKQRSKSQTSAVKPNPVKSIDNSNLAKKSLTLQLPSVSNTLSALDDFDAPSYPSTRPSGKQQTSLGQQAKSPLVLANQSPISPSMLNSLKQKQRIVVPHDKFPRVMGRGSCNIKVIQDVTGALLELEEKKIPPNNDRSILIRGETLDVTRYAFELLQALINDSDVDLLNLLPSNKNVGGSSGPAGNKPKLQGNPGQVVNKWNLNNDLKVANNFLL